MSGLTKNINATCLVCMNHIETNLIPCGCNVCLECSFEWIKTQNLETLYLDQHFFSCPNFSCKKKIESDWIYQNWPREIVNELNEILLKKYLNGSENLIKKCPKTGCNYSGFVDTSNNKEKCGNPYICEVCLTTWTDQNINCFQKSDYNFYNYFLNFLFILNVIKSQILEEISEIRISVLYKSCVHCDRVINKFVGCDHVTCVCKREFCYNCSKDYTDHLNNTQSCQISIGLKNFFLTSLILEIILKSIFSSNLMMSVISYIIWLLWVEIFGIGFLIFTGLILFGWITLLLSKNRIVFINIIKIIVTLLVFAGLYLMSRAYFHYEFFRISMKLMLYEGIIGLAIVAVVVINKHCCKKLKGH